MRIFFQRGAAACGVGDDGVELVGEKSREVCTSQVAHTSVRGKRAAANLSGGDHNLAAIRLQHAYGGAIEITESDLRHASGEERDSGALLSLSGESSP